MNKELFKKEVGIELSNLDDVLKELALLWKDVEHNTFTTRDKFATLALMLNLFNGIENILKRTCRFCGIILPTGAESHREIMELFTIDGNKAPLPPRLSKT